MRKTALGLLLALSFLAPTTAAFGQACPAVAALPDTERRVAYSPAASTGPFSVTFAIYGDGTDAGNWLEVWLNGVLLTYTTDWTFSLSSGTTATACRPMTNGQVTLVAPGTGTLQIVGGRRPRRTSQFAENRGVAARDLNQALTDIIAQNRETWDKINDVTGRGLFSQPGNTLSGLPLPSACASKFLGFDATGLIPQCLAAGPGSGNVTGPLTSTDNALVRWDGATGALVQNSTVTLSDAADMAGLGSITWASGGTNRIGMSVGTQNVLQMSGQGNSKTTAIHLNPGTGTLPTDTIAEFVLQRTFGQAFGGDYGRWSFTALGSASSNVSGIYGEFGGATTPTAFILNLGVENPPATFTSYEFLRLQPSGAAEAAAVGTVSFGAAYTSQKNQINLNIANIGAPGQRDSHAILWEGKANDGTERGVWWRQYTHVTSNAGASSFLWQKNLNGAGWTTMLSLVDSGVLAATTLNLTNPLTPQYGGTGIANNAASTLAISGNFATTLTITNTTSLTLPTAGTLATLAGAESLSNKTIPAPILSGTVTGTYTLGGTPTFSGGTVAASSIVNTNTVTLTDTNFTLQDDGNNTRQFQFQLSGITAGNTRTWTVPDSSDTFVGLAATQILTNKTITYTAGTTSVAPATLTSGPLLTSPVAGAIEYLTDVFYATPNTSNRAVVATEHFCALTADYTLTDNNSAQKAFNCSTNGAVTLPASTSYYFEAVYLITNTGTTSHTWSVLFGGGASFTSIAYSIQAYTGITSATTLTALSAEYSTVATAVVVTAASTSSTENITIILRGIMRISGTGTVIPQVQLSAATTGVEKMLKNSYFRLWPIGTDAVATVGNWS